MFMHLVHAKIHRVIINEVLEMEKDRMKIIFIFVIPMEVQS